MRDLFVEVFNTLKGLLRFFITQLLIALKILMKNIKKR